MQILVQIHFLKTLQYSLFHREVSLLIHVGKQIKGAVSTIKAILQFLRTEILQVFLLSNHICNQRAHLYLK